MLVACLSVFESLKMVSESNVIDTELALSLCSSNEPGAVSQCLCLDESTINIGKDISWFMFHIVQQRQSYGM